MGARTRIRLTRILMLVIGVYLVYWGFVYKGKDDIWDYMAVSGAIYSTGAFSLLLWGLYWKKASSTGAVMALVSGGFAVFGLDPVQSLFGFHVSSAWVGLAVVALTSLVMVAGSLAFPDRARPGRGRR
jgi:SSS family solute:Na+ symporter